MHDVDHILEIITKAGAIAREHFLRVQPVWKEDRSYVTEADVAVQAYLTQELDAAYPYDGILGEENGLRKEPRIGNRRWIIDPIDGTAAFSAGLPIWGIAVALVDGDRPIAGYFHVPTTQDVIYTTAEGGNSASRLVLRNGQPRALKQPGKLHRESSLFIASRVHRYYTVSPAYPGKLRNLGSSMAHLSYVATGSADCALVERVYVWDIAAGLAMLNAVGGVMRYLDARPVTLGPLIGGARMPQPALAGHPQTVDAFSEIVTFRGQGFMERSDDECDH